MTMDWSQVKGFNYQPSYARNGYEVWHDFDAATISTEIGRGVKYFPRMNALRIWVAWEYFVHHPQECEARFEQWLGIADGYGLKVMPCLFNRWHSGKPDYGGIYIDHLLRGVTWGHKDILFRPYLEAIVGQHAWDPRIIGWDLCNEPFTYSPATIPNIEQAEYEWLEELYRTCKQLGAQAPLSIGVVQMHGKAGLERVSRSATCWASIHTGSRRTRPRSSASPTTASSTSGGCWTNTRRSRPAPASRCW